MLVTLSFALVHVCCRDSVLCAGMSVAGRANCDLEWLEHVNALVAILDKVLSGGVILKYGEG